MVFKFTLRVIIFISFLYGIWYTYEFINPWIGIIAGILITAFIIDRIINKSKIKNKFKF